MQRLQMPSPSCKLCLDVQNNKLGLRFLDGLGRGMFAAVWDPNPVTPGHASVVPKRHVPLMQDLTSAEREVLFDVVIEVKQYIREMRLIEMYKVLQVTFADTKSATYIERAIELLQQCNNRPPNAFNDGLNDGPAAGQTISHFHWHVMPRWEGDVPDPHGGIRHMFSGMGNYKHGL